MANIAKTTIDNGGALVPGTSYEDRDELIAFGGAGTLLAGTILARDSVSLKMIAFVKGGATNGNGVPKGIILYPVTAAGAGDVKSRVVIRADARKERLVIDADASDTNIDAAVIDQLRTFGITPVNTQQLAILDP
jgi:hypothetical protein